MSARGETEVGGVGAGVVKIVVAGGGIDYRKHFAVPALRTFTWGCFYDAYGVLQSLALRESFRGTYSKYERYQEYKEVNMYAVIKTGGKQYRVASGEKIKVEQIAADVGQEIVIDQVLAVGNGAELKVGTPLVSGATVKATVVAHGKHDKVRIFKLRRRKHYQKRQGHRQQFTELQIGVIAA